MKIATWNVNSLKVRLPHVLQWLEDNPVDVLCLQETKLTDDKFPVMEIGAAGYQVAFTGQKTYNGVAILSKKPVTDIVKNNPLFPDEQQRIVAATVDNIRIVCAYVPVSYTHLDVYKRQCLHDVRHPHSGSPASFQRFLPRHGNQRRWRVQPLEKPRHHPLETGYHTG